MSVQGLRDDAPAYPPIVETPQRRFLFAFFGPWAGIYLELLNAYLTKILETAAWLLHSIVRYACSPLYPQHVIQCLPT